MKLFLSLICILLFTTSALADNIPIDGEYVYDTEGVKVDDTGDGVPACGDFAFEAKVRYSTETGLSLYFSGKWYRARYTGKTDDGGVYAVFPSTQLIGKAGQQLVFHLWYPDDGAINGRIRYDAHARDGSPCSDAWRYGLIHFYMIPTRSTI